jgi:hypothetical protein
MAGGWNQIDQVQDKTFKLAVLNLLTPVFIVVIITIIIIASSLSVFTVS